MSKREKRLAAAAALMVLAVLGRAGMQRIAVFTEVREKRLAAIERSIGDREIDVARGELAAARLAYWQQRSLPTDRDSAMGLYTQWLHDCLAKSELSDVNVASHAGVAAENRPQQITFTVDARTGLRQLSDFLFSFYRTGHLHKVRSLRISPTGKANTSGGGKQAKEAGQLDVHLVIEAMILPGADRADRLTSTLSHRLMWAGAEQYREKIAERNLFAAFQPKPDRDAAKEADKEKKDALAGQIVVTGLLGNGGAGQVWLNIRTTGRTLKLGPGDPFHVEGIRGTITSIAAEAREVVITTGGKQLRVGLGQSLAEGKSKRDKQG
ncbi:MAG: hypothetical protein ACC645_02115 [Pirellulales bacterium]